MKGKKYLEFLRYCLDDAAALPASSSRIDWMKMMAWAEEQAVVGTIYTGIQRAGKQLQIPFDDLMEWIGYAQQIETQNKLVNKRTAELTEMLQGDGMDCCILKGQGNAMMYPDPLMRTSGDIDVYVTPMAQAGEGAQATGDRPTSDFVRRVITYVRRKNPGAKAVYHHIEYGDFKDVEVEVHYRQTFINNMIRNRRLQRYLTAGPGAATKQVELPGGTGRIKVPAWQANVVFQMSHIYHHVIQSGLGMRQIVDYYYLLRQADGMAASARDGIAKTLQQTGLAEVAGAVMWLLSTLLGMDDRYLIAPTDERRGRFLLEEIMTGGNFGQYDSRSGHSGRPLAHNIERLRRDIRLMRYFPSECLWEPVFRLWHFFWRIRFGWRTEG
ncbi:MAG: nucleotidyltransferase family protein [Prevotella sp.]|nr:nucleotidyltransferase family protein [Prevotella sp.]